MEKLWYKLTMAVVAIIAMIWIFSTFYGSKPSEKSDKIEAKRQALDKRLSAAKLDPETNPDDATFAYKSFQYDLPAAVKQNEDASIEKIANYNPNNTLFYRKPQLPLIMKKGVGTTGPKPDEPLPPVYAEFDAPLSATFIPSNAGNLIKVQLANIDTDRHMIRLAVEIQRKSRKPMTEGVESPWSDWKTIYIEPINNSPLTAKMMEEKLGIKPAATGDRTDKTATPVTDRKSVG
jgi:hypothetical protein